MFQDKSGKFMHLLMTIIPVRGGASAVSLTMTKGLTSLLPTQMPVFCLNPNLYSQESKPLTFSAHLSCAFVLPLWASGHCQLCSLRANSLLCSCALGYPGCHGVVVLPIPVLLETIPSTSSVLQRYCFYTHRNTHTHTLIHTCIMHTYT